MADDVDEPEPDEAKARVGQMSEAEIDYNVMGTFPASDPPSWTLGISRNKKPQSEFEGEKPSASDPSHKNESVTSG